jgi:hypothetical protein
MTAILPLALATPSSGACEIRGLAEPLSPEPSAHGWLGGLIERGTLELLDTVGRSQVEGVILTGSLARGEATVLVEDGRLRLLGDVEFVVILRMPFDLRRARRQLLAFGNGCGSRLEPGPHPPCFEFVPAGIDYLRYNIRPGIFAHDLRTHGRVIWGRSDLLEEIGAFDVTAIPRDDAIRLVLNRTIEFLAQSLQTVPADSIERGYTLDKTLLDLAGSALAFSGRYVSRYGERGGAFSELLEADPDLSLALGDLSVLRAELAQAMSTKRQPSRRLLERGDFHERSTRVFEWARGLWIWQMQRVLSTTERDPVALVERYFFGHTLRKRARGWVKYWWHPLRPKGGTDWFKAARLFWKASPQELAYAAALLTNEATRDGGERALARAAAFLPVRFPSGGVPRHSTVLRESVDLWRWLVRNN